LTGLQIFLDDGPTDTVQKYCSGGSSAGAGCYPFLRWIGSTSLSSGQPFEIETANVDGQRNGGFFYGLTAASIPFSGDASLCIAPPVQRAGGVQSTGGVAGQCEPLGFTVDFSAWAAANPSAMGLPMTIGTTLYFQAWYRDPGHGPKNANLTSALRATFEP
jgi:hypothetical protein